MSPSTHDWRERVADYHSGGVSEGERRAVEAHLAECAECRAALAAYGRLYVLARSPLRLDAEQTDTSDEPNPGNRAPQPTPLPYRLFPARAFARAFPAASPARSALLAVLAASLVLAGFAALLLPRLRDASSQTAYLPSLGSIAMVSSDEGWAAGRGLLWHYTGGRWGYVPYPLVDSGGGSQPFGDPANGTNLQALAPDDIWGGYDRDIYHYDGQQWSIAYALSSNDQPMLRDISMSSPNDGWAVGATWGTWHPVFLHYHAGQWTRVSYGPDSTLYLWQVTSISPDEAWASGNAAPLGSGISAPVLLHYSHGQWQQAPLPTGLSFIGKIVISRAGDGWMSAIRGAGQPATTSGVLLRYEAGSWRIERELGQGVWISDLALTSPNDGWAVGTGLWHYTNGRWDSVPIPAGASGAQLGALGLFSADEGWASGNGVLLHLHQGIWQVYGRTPVVSGRPTGPVTTPTIAPACTPPDASTAAIRPGGLGAQFVTLPERWGTERLADGGGEYLGAYTGSGAPRAYVDNAEIGAPAVLAFVYLVDPAQHLALDQARALVSGIIPRDASRASPLRDPLPVASGMTETYCSASFAHLLLTQPPNSPYNPPYAESPGLLDVTYVYRHDGDVDRIVFAPA